MRTGSEAAYVEAMSDGAGTRQTNGASPSPPLLALSNVEVLYAEVILALK